MNFTYLVLGHDMEKIKNGFAENGNWTLFKCFIREGKKGYGEFYININTRTGEGELVKKDDMFGDFLVKKFTEELKPS